jgi:uncharacterized protein YdeI (YjbR/CyaY-like superfamily)
MATSSGADCEKWFQDRSDFAKPICEKLRGIIHQAAPDLEEVIRWGMLWFKGQQLVCGIGAFKAHVRLIFFRGAELEDPHGLFQRDENDTTAHGTFYTAASDIQVVPLRDLLKRAVKLDEGGKPKPQPKVKRAEIPVPEILRKALAKDKVARQAFEALAPSHRREYNEWISSAKQPETMQRRLEKTLAKLAAVEDLNAKYRKK